MHGKEELAGPGCTWPDGHQVILGTRPQRDDIWWCRETMNPESLNHPSWTYPLPWWCTDPEDSLVLMALGYMLHLDHWGSEDPFLKSQSLCHPRLILAFHMNLLSSRAISWLLRGQVNSSISSARALAWFLVCLVLYVCFVLVASSSWPGSHFLSALKFV